MGTRAMPIYLFLILLVKSVCGYLNIDVSNVGYSYSVTTVVGSTPYDLVIDTGSYELVTRNASYILEKNFTTYGFCLYLTVDGTYAQYVVVNSQTCPVTSNLTSIGSASAQVSISTSEYLSLGNSKLHDWINDTAGDLGLSYQCGEDSCSTTPFQSILLAADPSSGANQTFGLDFRDPNSTIASISRNASSMQMAGVLPDYSSTLIWQGQPTTFPPYHQFFIEDVSFCGTPILGNFSLNWHVLVDTGAACLTLPGEIYDSFAAWLNNSVAVDTWSDLPAISFQITGNDQFMYLPLGALVIATDAIINEPGAPYITSNQLGSARLCVLRGADIENSLGDYTSPTPTIVFGSMALRPFYFAANFAEYSVALSSKLTSDEVDYYSQSASHFPTCAKPVSCSGQRTYDSNINACNPPRCKQYYFQTLDSEEANCIYQPSALGFGVFFISLIAAMEVVSYFLMQFTAQSLIDAGRINAQHVYIDRPSIVVGKYLSYVVDYFVRHCMLCLPTRGGGVVAEEQGNELLRHV